MVGERGRIELGERIAAFALLVRRASAPAAAFGLCTLVLEYPSVEPINPAATVVAPTLAFALFRIVVVGIAACAWMIFPPAYRTFLAEQGMSSPRER